MIREELIARMESEPNNPLDSDPPANPEPTPVLDYRSAKSNATAPTAADAIASAVGIMIAIVMLGATGGLLVGIVAAARAGMVFGALALLLPLGMFLAGGLSALRSVAVMLRFTSETAWRNPVEDRQWRDTMGAIFAAIFGIAALIVLVLLIPEFVSETASLKKMFASAMIGLVLFLVAARSLRRAWYDFGRPRWTKRKR